MLDLARKRVSFWTSKKYPFWEAAILLDHQSVRLFRKFEATVESPRPCSAQAQTELNHVAGLKMGRDRPACLYILYHGREVRPVLERVRMDVNSKSGARSESQGLRRSMCIQVENKGRCLPSYKPIDDRSVYWATFGSTRLRRWRISDSDLASKEGVIGNGVSVAWK